MKETKKEVNWISVPPLRVYSRPNINSTSTRKENINEKYMTHDKVAGRWDGPAAQALRVNLAFSQDLIWFCEATFTGVTMKPILWWNNYRAGVVLKLTLKSIGSFSNSLF